VLIYNKIIKDSKRVHEQQLAKFSKAFKKTLLKLNAMDTRKTKLIPSHMFESYFLYKQRLKYVDKLKNIFIEEFFKIKKFQEDDLSKKFLYSYEFYKVLDDLFEDKSLENESEMDNESNFLLKTKSQEKRLLDTNIELKRTLEENRSKMNSQLIFLKTNSKKNKLKNKQLKNEFIEIGESIENKIQENRSNLENKFNTRLLETESLIRSEIKDKYININLMAHDE